MKYDSNRENVQIAAAWLREMGYDAWLTATRERSDPAVKAIFGSVVVGSGVYLVTKEGKAYLVANAIDVQEETYPEEADFVADKIQTMLRDRVPVRKNGILAPVEPEDIVILLRSPGSAAGYFQRALETRGIRCASGGGTDLLNCPNAQQSLHRGCRR